MAYANQDAVKAETNEQPFNPTNFENLPDLSDVVVCPSETGSNSYDCLLEAILLPIQYRDVFVGLRSPWKGGTNASALCCSVNSSICQCCSTGLLAQEQTLNPKPKT